MRTASLKPRYRRERAESKIAAWCVNVPPSLSTTGKRQQLYFNTKNEAERACEQIRIQKENLGTSVSSLSSDRIIEAVKAYKLLEGTNVSLISAIQQFVEIHKARSKSITWQALIEEYLPTLAGCTHEHIKGTRNALLRYPEVMDKLVSDVTHKDLEDLMANDSRGSVGNGARKNLVNAWSAFFGYAIHREYMDTNPVKKLLKPRVKRTEVEIISVDHVEAMLNDALINDPELVPLLVFGFFCGIRPDGELQRMEWSAVGLNDAVPQVTLKPEWTKKNKRRHIDLAPNAIAWLRAYQQRCGRTEGLVVPWRGDRTVQDHRQANRARAGVDHWPNSAMRHSFCSYWLAKHHDANKLILMSGHTDSDVMWTNYHRGCTEAEASKFWSILPPVAPSNVVQMPAVA